MELMQICVKELLNNKDNVAIENLLRISLDEEIQTEKTALSKGGEYV